MTLTQRFSNRRLLVDGLALMFGVGAWIGVNGIYVQLPILVNMAPEGWSLPAYMVMLVQVANFGPVLYSLYAKYAAAPQDSLIISTLLGASTIATFTLAFIYQKTSMMFNAEYSSGLLGLMFVTAVVGCTSSVLFMPFMRNYREIYLVSYLVGEGLSGFLPSVVALIQGVGGNPECINSTSPDSDVIEITTYYPEPRFSTQAFFIFLSIVLFMSFTSFIALTKTSIARRELVKPPGSTETLPTDTSALPTYKTSSGWNMAVRTYVYLLIMMSIVCCLGNAALASIQSYSCLPYGNVAYHLTVTLGSMAGPLAMSLGFVIKNPKIHVLSWLTVLILALSAYLFYLALQSPSPPFQNTWYGEFLVVISWILVNGLIGFVKMGITTLFRPDPGRGLFYTGVATQIGSLLGAITTFVMVNVLNMFQSYSPCV